MELLLYLAQPEGNWKAMAPHSSTLAWKIPWMEEPGRLQSTGSLRVRHYWATSLSLSIFMHWRRKWQPTPVFLPGESHGWRSLVLQSTGSHRVGHDWSDLAEGNCHSVTKKCCLSCWLILGAGIITTVTIKINCLNSSSTVIRGASYYELHQDN